MRENNLLLIVMASSILLLFGACSTESEKTTVPSGATQDVEVTATNVNSGPTSIKYMDKSEERRNMIKKRRTELENLTPVDQAKFESWIPETLGDLKRTSFEFKSSPLKGELAYMNDANGKNIEITIFDGAGKDGAFRFEQEANFTGTEKEGFEEKTDFEIYQIKKRSGEYSGEYYYKGSNSSKIKTILEDRYIVSATGYKMDPDELWKYIESLNFKELK
ncbi:MAG: hypothetical protein ABI290_05215 [Ginsengibacter sp.]